MANPPKHTLSVTAVIENDGDILFMQRKDDLANFPAKWVFPGGKVEPGEDAIEALVREIDEEVGIKRDFHVAFLDSYSFVRSEDESTAVGLVFLIKVNRRSISVEKSAFQDYQWIKPEQVFNFDTIYGMEVHVRNALIAMKKNCLWDWKALSVSHYQDKDEDIKKIDLERLRQNND